MQNPLTTNAAIGHTVNCLRGTPGADCLNAHMHPYRQWWSAGADIFMMVMLPAALSFFAILSILFIHAALS